MVDRFLVWLSAGVVTAGMSAAMLHRRRFGGRPNRIGVGPVDQTAR